MAEHVSRIASGLTAADVVAAPYALIGSYEQLVDELEQHRARWGISSYVVRADAVDLVAPLIERLRS